jgi:hypothetical protein
MRKTAIRIRPFVKQQLAAGADYLAQEKQVTMTRGHSSFPKGAEGITFGNVLRLFLNAEVVREMWRNMAHTVLIS